MTRPLSLLFAAGALCVALAGCSTDNLARKFGIERTSPDEFTVTTRAPLTMPPDFTLHPPQPGAARPQELSERQQAEAVLSPQTALTGGAAPATAAVAASSPGQQALLRAAGPAAPANIRAEINAEGRTAQAPSLTDRLLFWKATPAATNSVIDPNAEAARLRRNAALGQNPDTGNTPIYTPPSTAKGLFGGNGFLGLF